MLDDRAESRLRLAGHAFVMKVKMYLHLDNRLILLMYALLEPNLHEEARQSDMRSRYEVIVETCCRPCQREINMCRKCISTSDISRSSVVKNTSLSGFILLSQFETQ